jgi:hypothetical protein
MNRAISLHLGVNHPKDGRSRQALEHSEATAWRMAELASQAGYDAVSMLRGREANRHAVYDALVGAAKVLGQDDIIFVSFSGHGEQTKDGDHDERDGWDEAWCLHDGILLDDKLAGFWKLFEPGVRILIVSESCFGGGIGRFASEEEDGGGLDFSRNVRGFGSNGHGPSRGPATARKRGDPCIGQPPANADGIRASLLLLSASAEDEPAKDGLFSKHLFELWNEGEFRESYCELHGEIQRRVRDTQDPQILMLGARDLAFSTKTAFHLDSPKTHARQAEVVYR